MDNQLLRITDIHLVELCFLLQSKSHLLFYSWHFHDQKYITEDFSPTQVYLILLKLLLSPADTRKSPSASPIKQPAATPADVKSVLKLLQNYLHCIDLSQVKQTGHSLCKPTSIKKRIEKCVCLICTILYSVLTFAFCTL